MLNTLNKREQINSRIFSTVNTAYYVKANLLGIFLVSKAKDCSFVSQERPFSFSINKFFIELSSNVNFNNHSLCKN